MFMIRTIAQYTNRSSDPSMEDRGWYHRQRGACRVQVATPTRGHTGTNEGISMNVPALLFACVMNLLLAAGPGQGQESGEPYRASVSRWRLEQEIALKADDGWLTVAGLFFLKEGPNRVGTDPSNDIVLPPGSAPPHVGVFRFSAGRTVFEADPAARVTVNGKPLTTAALQSDNSGTPDVVAVGSLSMFVIKRGGRYALRLRDKDNGARRRFSGLRWFPVNESYRVTARFVPYSPPKPIPVVNVLGDVEDYTRPGYVVFRLNGREFRLEPVTEGAGDRLFLIFKDRTAAVETYPAGRFLYADPPRNGQVLLDFNKAVNPPCAFTKFATCPLPPKQNQLPVRIEAGERYSEHKQ
jgi:uncharacterized protein (DUF1684 family)